jgi:peptidylprolyl isomerase
VVIQKPMKLTKIFRLDWCKRLLKSSIVVLMLVSLSVSLSGAGWNQEPAKEVLIAALAQGNAITDPTAILRYSLPIDNESVRQLQGAIEDISNHLRGKRWGPISKDVKVASKVLTLRDSDLLDGVPDDRKPKAQVLIAQLQEEIPQLQDAVKAQDKDLVWNKRREILDKITDLEELMVKGFPFEVRPNMQTYLNLKVVPQWI